MAEPILFRLSKDDEDRDWDRFLESQPNPHHAQTSWWAQVKRELAWEGLRLTATVGERLVGGVQILYRQLPVGGAIGYAPYGPVTAGNAELASGLLDRLTTVVRERRIRFLLLQPPTKPEVERAFDSLGFRTSSVQPGPTATVRIALSGDLDGLLRQMKSRTRYNIRLSERRGVRIREGSADDLLSYYRLVIATGRRQGFSVPCQRYFRRLWSIAEPRGHVKLFLAEYRGEVIAAQLALVFGDTIVNKLSVWSGSDAAVRPNEAVYWAALRWAASNDYRWYDFEGIDREAARAVLANASMPPSTPGVTSFKLGFGGHPVLLPLAREYVPSAALAAFARYAPLGWIHRPGPKHLLNMYRTRSSKRALNLPEKDAAEQQTVSRR